MIISGDSDFSPLVSKLRENNKAVIGVGVRQSCSDLLVANCDEFIFYDDLVPKEKPARKRRSAEKSGNGKNETKAEEPAGEESLESGLDLILETTQALAAESGENQKIWGSMVKQTLRRRRPGFRESRYGFRSFNLMLEEAASRGLLTLERDEKSGGYIITGFADE